MPDRNRRKLLGLAAVAAVAIAAGIAMHAGNSLRFFEQQSVDARFRIRGDQPQRLGRFVLVKIDDATFNYFRNAGRKAQWPFPRRYHAQVIDRLRAAGAGVIALDIEFNDPSDAADDNALITSVEHAHRVVLATSEVAANGSDPVFGGHGAAAAAGARVGHSGWPTDSDGTVRRMRYSIDRLQTFPVAIAAAAQGRAVSPALFGGATGSVPVDFSGPPGTLRSITYARVYAGDFPKDFFRGKIVLVGAAAPSLQDQHETPLARGVPMYGSELAVNGAATALAGVPLRPSRGWLDALLLAIFVIVICAAASRLGTVQVVLLGTGLLLVWAVAAQLAFNAGHELDFMSVAAALVLATGGSALVGMWSVNRERDELRSLFAADSADVVDRVLHSPSSRSLEPTDIIAGYELEDVIGRGGMGVVYRARQLALGRQVALKLIAADRAADPEFRERFEQESRLAAAIDHPSVIPVYEASDDHGLLFIAMRLVDGTDLATLIAREAPLDPARVVRIVFQIAGALDAAHAAGLVHRDVKPANVLLTLDRADHLYLTDFGVAKQIDAGAEMTMAGRWVGTLDYLAPEQIRGEPAGEAADIYALAAVVFQCLTGSVPYPRENDAARMWAHVNAPPPRPSELVDALPTAIDAVIARGLAKDPAARFPSATALAEACAAALGVAKVVPDRDASAREDTPSAPSAPTIVSD